MNERRTAEPPPHSSSSFQLISSLTTTPTITSPSTSLHNPRRISLQFPASRQEEESNVRGGGGGGGASRSRSGRIKNIFGLSERVEEEHSATSRGITDPIVMEEPAPLRGTSEVDEARGGKGKRKPSPVTPLELVGLLEQQREEVVVIDSRCLNAFLGEQGRVKKSINVAFPSLLCKRFSKLGSTSTGCTAEGGAGAGSLNKFTLEPFITTSLGKSLFSSFHDSTLEGKQVVVIDDKMHGEGSRGRGDLNPGLVLLGVLEKKRELENEDEEGRREGGLWYLDRTLGEAAKGEERLRKWVVWGENQDELDDKEEKRDSIPVPLLQSQTRRKPTLTRIIASPSPSPSPSSSLPPPFAFPTESQCASPTILSPHQRSLPSSFLPPPTTTTSNARQLPKLRRIDTSENLLGPHSRPGVSSATIPNSHNVSSSIPLTAATNTSSSGAGNRRSPPPRLNLDLLNLDDPPPPTSSSSNPPHASSNGGGGGGMMSLQEMCHSQSKSPPATATRFREAELSLPTSPNSHHSCLASPNHHSNPLPLSPLEDPDLPPPFNPSLILSDFLYLGPEPLRPSDLTHLKSLGIQEILNLAVECPPDREGKLEREFSKYWFEPMRDSLEELGVQDLILKCCRILNEAKLRSRKVYVHCRAGKSRSVTIVLGYLLYQMGWSLKRAYQFVQERREGISPNLGFMAELMTFEERLRQNSSSFSNPHVPLDLSSSSSSSSPTLQRSHSAISPSTITISSLGSTPTTNEMIQPGLPLPGLVRLERGHSDFGPRAIPNRAESEGMEGGGGGARAWKGTSRAVRALIAGGEDTVGDWREASQNSGELESRTSLETSPIASCG